MSPDTLTVCGFRSTNSLSRDLFDSDWGPGFLGEVARAAADAYRRDAWTRTWTERALGANDAVEFWRCGYLAAGVADRRFEHWLRLDMGRPLVWRFGRCLATRLAKQAERTRKKREDTLFGLRKPERNLVIALRSSRPGLPQDDHRPGLI